MIDDYELLIEDYKPTRKEIIKIINNAIKADRAATKTTKGLEIEVPDSWVEVLQNDAAILYDYGKVGWKVTMPHRQRIACLRMIIESGRQQHVRAEIHVPAPEFA